MTQGKIEAATVTSSIAQIQVTQHSRNAFRPIARKGAGERYRISIDLEGTLDHTERPGIFVFTPFSAADMWVTPWFPPKTKAQQYTLWGVCRFIAWAQEDRKPTDTETYWIREGIIGAHSPWMDNPVTGQSEPLRPSDPRMDTKTMATLVHAALEELAHTSVSADVADAIGKDMKSLWREFYRWRTEKRDDPLDGDIESWEEYCRRHTVCEATGEAPSESDTLERCHIVAVGADKSLEEAPWNWLRMKHTVHRYQHQVGWDQFLREYPHLEPKVQKAWNRFHDEKQGDLYA